MPAAVPAAVLAAPGVLGVAPGAADAAGRALRPCNPGARRVAGCAHLRHLGDQQPPDRARWLRSAGIRVRRGPVERLFFFVDITRANGTKWAG